MVTPEQARRFFNKEITAQELFGESPAKDAPKPKKKRPEDALQADYLAWFASVFPDVPIYGNATANIFNSGGMYRKALPKSAFKTLASMGIESKTWGHLIDHALKRLGLSLRVDQLEKDQAGAKFAQMARTKSLGAVAAWPDIQVCGGIRKVQGVTFAGLFLELKAEEAAAQPWLKSGHLASDKHIQEQAQMLSRLWSQGYMALFAVGIEQATAATLLYMGKPCEGWKIIQQTVEIEGKAFKVLRIRRDR